MANSYIHIVDGEYQKAKAPGVPQPWKPQGSSESSGGGLPDPSSYSDGTVLVKVGDEWKAQSGYGYESDGAVHTIDPKFIPNALPSYTSADEGKMLKIVDGAAVWSTVPSAENGTF